MRRRYILVLLLISWVPVSANAGEDMPSPGLLEYLGKYYKEESGLFDPRVLARLQAIKARRELEEIEGLASEEGVEQKGDEEESGVEVDAGQEDKKFRIKKKEVRRANEKSRGL